ncbi:hypothetical protein EJ06DRAFT_168577 [Trichodelitschia bisporula]|uniref:Uncharacterized protein n=1 Tax=Trichodelitschia bisporula TaxID=703511 RepID=A0A6G1HMG4_9PEZI|nr:hypothetical protein EJ06DRAFT_168577 [Trichodelitschia bisporula]
MRRRTRLPILWYLPECYPNLSSHVTSTLSSFSLVSSSHLLHIRTSYNHSLTTISPLAMHNARSQCNHGKSSIPTPPPKKPPPGMSCPSTHHSAPHTISSPRTQPNIAPFLTASPSIFAPLVGGPAISDHLRTAAVGQASKQASVLPHPPYRRSRSLPVRLAQAPSSRACSPQFTRRLRHSSTALHLASCA